MIRQILPGGTHIASTGGGGERKRDALTEQVEEEMILHSMIGQHIIAFIINTHQFDPSIIL